MDRPKAILRIPQSGNSWGWTFLAHGVLVVAAALFATANAWAQYYEFTYKGVVDEVRDGNTLVMLVEARYEGKPIRWTVPLADIDAPEVCHRQSDPRCRKPGQRFGHEAAAELRRLTLGKQANAHCSDSGFVRYTGIPHITCYVEVDGVKVNMAMARTGLVWWPGFHGRDPAIKAAVDSARRAKRGVFSEPWSVDPAIWRRDCWNGHRVCALSVFE